MTVLSRDDYGRYSRQLLVAEMDEVKQQALSHAEVVIVGLGGLGCAVAPYLAGAGVGRLRLVDGDEVELSNLPRQPLYGEPDIGEAKASVASQRLRDVARHLPCRTKSSAGTNQRTPVQRVWMIAGSMSQCPCLLVVPLEAKCWVARHWRK